MSDPWRIDPLQGLGLLRFGMSPAEVAALADVYGAPTALLDNAYVIASTEDIIAQFGHDMSPDEIATLRQIALEQATLVSQNLDGPAPTLLEYHDGRLDCVMVEPACGPVTFQDRPVFDLDARDALALFETANGAPGRYRSTEAAFDNLAVSLGSFSVIAPAGSLQILTQADDEFSERSIAVRQVPYRPENEIGQFIARSVL
ncbi:hypothetical protein [Methylopila sp. M107]|uniref:hypothetical protein n=1 Tax=Methylopila sp. M107 TaxID=1101190 RepID=UPI00038040CE|nr:hypothetical protein [Methylopila sp. M107]